MNPIDSIIVLVVSLAIGSIGIFIGARLITGATSAGKAVEVALLGAVLWSILAWISVLGPLLALIVWVTLINVYYSGGIVDAIMIGLLSWLATLTVLYLLTLGGFTELQALGVPGV